MFSKKLAVPDLAIVPILLTISSSLIPIPLSEIVIVFSSVLIFILIFRSLLNLDSFLFSTDSNLNLSNASDALETSSLINISLLEYKE